MGPVMGPVMGLVMGLGDIVTGANNGATLAPGDSPDGGATAAAASAGSDRDGRLSCAAICARAFGSERGRRPPAAAPASPPRTARARSRHPCRRTARPAASATETHLAVRTPATPGASSPTHIHPRSRPDRAARGPRAGSTPWPGRCRHVRCARSPPSASRRAGSVSPRTAPAPRGRGRIRWRRSRPAPPPARFRCGRAPWPPASRCAPAAGARNRQSDMRIGIRQIRVRLRLPCRFHQAHRAPDLMRLAVILAGEHRGRHQGRRQLDGFHHAVARQIAVDGSRDRAHARSARRRAAAARPPCRSGPKRGCRRESEARRSSRCRRSEIPAPPATPRSMPAPAATLARRWTRRRRDRRRAGPR